MKKYWAIFSLGLKNAFEYRGALLTWSLVEIMTLVSALFLWTGVFRNQTYVGNYDYQQIIMYYFLVPLVGTITTVHISERLPRNIKDGEMSKDLVKPYVYVLGFLVNQLAIKTVQNTIKIPVYIGIGAYLFSKYEMGLNPTLLLLGFILAILGYFIHNLIDTCLSLVAFWFDDTWSLSLLKQVTLMIFGGLAFPIDLIPETWRSIFGFLPFDLIYYFPVSVILGKISLAGSYHYLVKMFFWSLGLYCLIRWMWQKGSKKYCAYGQ